MARRPLKISVSRIAAGWADMWSGGVEQEGVVYQLKEKQQARTRCKDDEGERTLA
jgi:hypothetical protein